MTNSVIFLLSALNACAKSVVWKSEDDFQLEAKVIPTRTESCRVLMSHVVGTDGASRGKRPESFHTHLED